MNRVETVKFIRVMAFIVKSPKGMHLFYIDRLRLVTYALTYIIGVIQFLVILNQYNKNMMIIKYLLLNKKTNNCFKSLKMLTY